MTLGQKISYAAKAVAAFLIALVSLFSALLATVPEHVPDQMKSYVIWIQSALAFLTAAAVFIATNGPKVGNAIDTVDRLQDTFDDVRGMVEGKHSK